jgi:hypothetical protein
MPRAESDLNAISDRLLRQRLGIQERQPAGHGWLRLQMDSTTCTDCPIDRCATFVATVDGVCRRVILVLLLFALFLTLTGV